MSEEFPDAASTIQNLADKGRETLATAQSGAKDALECTKDYIRANPWVAVAGAAVIGGVIAVISHRKQAEQRSNVDAVRGWLDHAYEKLPTQKQFQSIAEASGVPDMLKQLRHKLHLD